MSTVTFVQAPSFTRIATSRSARGVSTAAPLQLTRRGKLAVLVAAALMIGVLAIMFGPSSTATGEAGVPQQTTSVQVLPGHTLWQIAADANPAGDIRATVDDIIELNSLPNASALQMGSQIAVPVYDK